MLLQIFDFIRVTPDGSESLEKTETNFSLETVWPSITDQAVRENAVEALIRDGHVKVSPTRFRQGTVVYQLTGAGYEQAKKLKL